MKKGFVYLACIWIVIFRSSLESYNKTVTGTWINTGNLEVMTIASKPISEATRNIALHGIILQSIKTILLYENE